jgi:hypothetical protein
MQVFVIRDYSPKTYAIVKMYNLAYRVLKGKESLENGKVQKEKKDKKRHD